MLRGEVDWHGRKDNTGQESAARIMARSIKGCMNCGETREIAAHGLCFRCYRQEERKLADDLWAKPDANAKDLAKTQRKTRKALMKMMDALEEIETAKLVPEATVEAWRELLRPEVARIALSLGEGQMSTEQKLIGELFSDSDEPSKRVNGEQTGVSEQFTERPHEDAGDLITEPINPCSEQVNSEQEYLSEQFTQPAEPLNKTILDDQFPADSAPTQQPSVLPPAVEQRVRKVKKEKGNSHAT
jgi:hypothetical protein